MNQSDLMKLRDESNVTSEQYQRAKDHIEDIRLDTNNNQIGDLTNNIKDYKIETDRNIGWDQKLTLIAIIIGTSSLVVTALSTHYTYKSVQIAIDPQIEVFIKRANVNAKENFIVGIENNGVSSVSDLNLDSSIIHMNKISFAKDETNASSVQQKLLSENKLVQSAEKQIPIFIEYKGAKWVGILYLDLSYKRGVDMRKFSQRIAFFIDGFGVYSFEEIKDIPEMQPIVKNFKLYSPEHLFDQRLYGQPF